MAKRTSDAADLQAPTAAKQRTAASKGAVDASSVADVDEGMGEFEDKWEDEMESDEEIVEDGNDEDDEDDDIMEEGNGDSIMFSNDVVPAPEDEEAANRQASPPREVYLPTSRPLAADEVLEPDNSVYLALHQLSYNWPCLSFDVLRDSLGWERSRFPHTAWVVAGTQAGEEISAPGGKAKDEIVVMRWGGLSKTQKDGDDSDEEDDEDPDEVDEDAHLEFLTIPHVGSVNRIRAQPMAPSPALLPPPSTPYHVASWSETGKVHIWDVRPLMEQLDAPSTAQPRSDKTRRPVHTITNHGREEGFALDWAASPGSTSDLRLLTGDVASQIYLTTTTPTGFQTQPKPFLSHTSSVEDLQWSPSEPTVFASCSADRSLRVWDVRVKNRRSVVALEDSHEQDVNVISWNKSVEYLLLSGGDEGGIKVWDLRNFKPSGGARPSPVAQFDWHKAPITSVEWHPTDSSTFAAASADDSVTLWDLAVEADEDEAAANKAITDAGITVPPQLLFVHQGQKDVKEIHWHPQISGMVCSTAGDGFNAFKTISV